MCYQYIALFEHPDQPNISTLAQPMAWLYDATICLAGQWQIRKVHSKTCFKTVAASKSHNFRVCAEIAEEYTSQSLINTLGRQLCSIKTLPSISKMSPLSFDCYILIITTTTKIMHLGVNKQVDKQVSTTSCTITLEKSGLQLQFPWPYLG